MTTIPTTAAIIERMAEKSGRHIEISNDTAYLSFGHTTWVAPLPPAGGAA